MAPVSGYPACVRGLVLAGGKSSRFGSNKALAMYRGARLIEHAVSLFKELDLEPIVSSRKDVDYAFLNCATIHDQLPDQGPLGGLYTALTIFPQTSFLVLTCDMPALTSSMLSKLLTERASHALITAYADRKGTMQPFPGIYEPSVADIIRGQFRNNRLSMRDLLERVSCKTVPCDEDQALVNVNSPQELLKLTDHERDY
ncbi:MAG: molybdenum cofactor guanylyltransferase [Candidatus Omnitrophica bacterium]|nr:molybdenum cofactor guanylyltransferase [Candidatus Omnitrophota bacterium]